MGNEITPVPRGPVLAVRGPSDAATANVVAESPLHFERALHASSLTASQVETLQAAFSDRMMDLLETLNREGQAMKETGTGDMRIRLGGYVFTTEESKSR